SPAYAPTPPEELSVMRLRLAVLLTPLFLAGILAAGKEDTQPAHIAYGKQIAPILGQYCHKCHSGAKPKGGFALDKTKGDGDRKTWEKVLNALKAREMPPEDKPQP